MELYVLSKQTKPVLVLSLYMELPCTWQLSRTMYHSICQMMLLVVMTLSFNLKISVAFSIVFYLSVPSGIAHASESLFI